jgi:hypothetical protein
MCRVVNAHVIRSSKDPATTGLGTVNGGMVTIILIAVPGRIWVEVTDDGCTPVPAVCPYQQEQLKLAEDGRGLQLVEILSARWELLQRRCGHGHLVQASRAIDGSGRRTSFLPVGSITRSGPGRLDDWRPQCRRAGAGACAGPFLVMRPGRRWSRLGFFRCLAEAGLYIELVRAASKLDHAKYVPKSA